MRTFHSEAYLRQVISEPQVESLGFFFDLVRAVDEVPQLLLPRQRDGEKRAFSSGLNIILGRSGCGKSNLLDSLKKPLLTPPEIFSPKRNLTNQAMGERIMGVFEILLHVQPVGSCLMIDEAQGCLDQANTKHMMEKLLGHKEQVILTVNPCQLERISSPSFRKVARIFEFPKDL